MAVTPHVFDILMVGGGVVGNALALALADHPLKIGIIEAQAPPSLGASTHRDERAIALTYASVRLCHSLGVWDAMAPYATAVQQVHVSEANRFGRVKFQASEAGFPFLGQVVNAHHLLDKLQTRVSQLSSVTTLYETKLKGLERDEKGYFLDVDHLGQSQRLSTRLLIAADGTQSSTRQLLNIPVQATDYHQNAIVATVQLSKPHQGIAYERFTPSGPLGALPLAGNSCVVVWTVPRDKVHDLMALSDKIFCEKLQRLWGYKLGRILSIERRQTFPLHSVFALQQVAPHAMLIGNAAHTLHPVAAQSLNLSLKDIAVFAEMVSEAIAQGQDPTRYALLETYAQSRKKEQKLISDFTHTLIHLFTNDLLPLAYARNLGLSALNLLPAAQKMFSKKAMGLVGRLPELMQS